MKYMIDIHTVLSTPADMEDVHDDTHEASERLNFILHALYDRCEEDIEQLRLEGLLQYAWDIWHDNTHLCDIDEDELLDWVDHALATWDDVDSELNH